MNVRSIILLIAVLNIRPLPGQKLTTLVEDHAINADRPESVHVEPHLAINPGDPDHMIVASIVLNSDFSEWTCACFTSFDGGSTWSRYTFEMERCIDPWVTITSEGSVFIAAIEILRDVKHDQRFNLLVYRSNDSGITWNEEKNSLGRGFDHELIIPLNESEYLMTARKARQPQEDSTLYDLYLAKIADEGSSIDQISQFKPDGTPDDINPTGIAANGNGTVTISFVEFPSFLTKSVQSTDGGRTFGSPNIITDRCGECTSFPGYPFLAHNQSSGDFYHVCIGPEFDGVWFSRSENGLSWVSALRLDEKPASGNPHVRTPMIAVNPSGVVGVAWYDRRNDPENNCQDIYFTYSNDGGEKFSTPSRISTITSCPNAAGNGETANSWPGGGDYSSLAIDMDGNFHIVWSDSRTGVAQLRHSTVKVEQ